ncbi:single-stranded DNA-binding protein [Saccharopolyspora hirsuta]|uniref:Single-stranded DNA-binding protein n=1 Tax=Saccharopolyspora hirsuta TaxID=1837 RepID=A0A5M7BNE3_SACHI|nr:single-stranded DNA-binding protein [Saccharopolyspora hirsuta]KAA5828784.1 single-stranded DNA-binding protein [Saccharopolyspora hirsuta]
MFETQVTVVGYVITEPVVRETAGGNRLVSFRVAATSRRFDQGTAQWVDGDRFLTTVNCWRRLADGVAGALTKGDPVVATGRLRTREYESGGQWRTAVEVEASAVGLDLARAEPPPQAEVRALAPAGVASPGG